MQEAEGRSNIACTVSLSANIQLDSYFRRSALGTSLMQLVEEQQPAMCNA
jgi:hypothetical protein